MTPGFHAGPVCIGCSGWSIPASRCCGDTVRGGELREYAALFDVVEVNATFYRTPTPATFARWCERTPENFRFALTLPEAISYQLPFGCQGEALARFLSRAACLNDKFAAVVMHLPPRFAFTEAARRTLESLRARIPVTLICDPHDPSWQSAAADQFLSAHQITRTGLLEGPKLCARAPGGWRNFEYVRVRRLPRPAPAALVEHLKALASRDGPERWWIFDREAAQLAALLAAQSFAESSPNPLSREAS